MNSKKLLKGIVDGPYERKMSYPETTFVIGSIVIVIMSMFFALKWLNSNEPVGEVPRFYKTQ